MAEALVIEDGGFRLEQDDIASETWDLYGRKKVNHKDGTSSTEWKIIGYGMSFPTCMNKIILCRMKVRHPEVMSLKEFFNNYSKERSEVLKSFNLQTINLTKDLINIQKQIKNENN